MSPLTAFLVKWGLIAAVIALLLVFVMGFHIQEGNRMYPFLMDGDLAVTYRLDPYRVGDVVRYNRPDTGKAAFARIVALGPGVVEVTTEGQLIVNGAVPEERVFYTTRPLEGSPILYPITLREGECFLLDDFRENGEDSRLYGPVPAASLGGKVVYVLRRRGI